MQWHMGQIWSPTVAGAAADWRWVSPSLAFPFQPFRATEAWGKASQAALICPALLTSEDVAQSLNAKPDNGKQHAGCEDIRQDRQKNANPNNFAVIFNDAK